MKKLCLFGPAILAVLAGSGCCLLVGPDEFEISTKKCADFSELVTLEVKEFGKSIVGIDTTDFTVKGHIKVDEDMSFSGADNTRDGRVVFTGGGRISTHTWGDLLYVMDNKCDVERKINIDVNPLAPVVFGDYVLVGSAAYQTGTAKFLCQIVSLDSYRIVKTFNLDDMVFRTHVTNLGKFIWISNWVPDGYGYLYRINTNTLKTRKVVPEENEFFYNTGFRIAGNDSGLVLASIVDSGVGKIGFFTPENGRLDTIIDPVNYARIAEKSFQRIDHPYYYDNKLFFRFSKESEHSGFIVYLAEFHPVSMELTGLHSVVETQDYYTYEFMQFYAGRFFVVQLISEKKCVVRFYDLETWSVARDVVLDETFK